MTLYGAPDDSLHDDGGNLKRKTEILTKFPNAEILEALPLSYETYVYGVGCSHDCEKHVNNRVVEVEKLEGSKYSINKAYIYDGTEYMWQIDLKSQGNISVTNSVALMSTIDPQNFAWEGEDREFRTADNETVTFLTALDFMKFAKAIQVHCRSIWQTCVNHKTALRLLADVEDTTETEINNYDITTGW